MAHSALIQPTITPSSHPPCFQDDIDFELWRLYARRSRGMRPASYCTDCTAHYQASMIEIDKCLHPDVTFREVVGWGGDVETIGLRPEHARFASRGAVV